MTNVRVRNHNEKYFNFIEKNECSIVFQIFQYNMCDDVYFYSRFLLHAAGLKREFNAFH